MQITFKQVGEWGQLSRPAKIAGCSLLGLAAVCWLAGAFLTVRQVLLFGSYIKLPTTSADQIKESIADITQTMGVGTGLFWTGGALAMLSLGCWLYGRRIPQENIGYESIKPPCAG